MPSNKGLFLMTTAPISNLAFFFDDFNKFGVLGYRLLIGFFEVIFFFIIDAFQFSPKESEKTFLILKFSLFAELQN